MAVISKYELNDGNAHTYNSVSLQYQNLSLVVTDYLILQLTGDFRVELKLDI